MDKTAAVYASSVRLVSYVSRIERLEDQKQETAEDIKEVFSEAKSEGFCVKTMKKVIKLRKMDTEDRLMEEDLLDEYKIAVGLTQGDFFEDNK